MRRTFSTILAMSLFASGAVARAQPAVPAQPPATQPQAAPLAQPQGFAPATKPGYRTHDGFFLQLNSGVGFMGSSGTAKDFPDVKMSGAAGAFSAAVGGAVVPNLILGGMIWDVLVLAPDVEVNGTSTSSTDAALGLFGVGFNVTYYFMPANIYVSATPSVGVLSAARDADTTYDTKAGFALRLAAGKEWWISGNWGLGVSLQYAYGGNDQKDGPMAWTTNWFGASFSATYN